MRTLRILLSFLVLGLVIGWLICYLAPQFWPEYTAEAFIRVLPGTEKASEVTLIRHKNNLESLIDRDKIQQTKWFQSLGKNKDERLSAGVSDLKRRFCAKAMRGGDLIRISMTCGNDNDAAVIVNEIADTFLKTQQGAKRKQIASNLMFLEDNHARLQRDLDLAERSLDDVRRRYGFTDLEEHNYPHPITARLIRLQSEEDDCNLDLEQLQNNRDALLSQPQQISSPGKPDPNQAAEIKDIELKIKLSQNRLAGLRKMREETEKKQEELDLARTQYVQRLFYRYDRRSALQSVKAKLEELKMLHDNPEVSGLELVDIAGIPQEPDSLPKEVVLPISAGAGLLIGIIGASLTGRKIKLSRQTS